MAGCEGLAAIHDRGTVEGWPPALSRAALPGGEPPHILAAPRAPAEAMGMVVGPGAPNPTPATPRRHERGSAPQGRRRCCRADRIGRWEGRCSTGTPWWPSTPGPSARGALVRTWSTGSTPPRPRPSWRPTCSRPSAPAGSSSVPAGAPSVMPSASLMTDSLDFTPITNSSEQASWVPCTAAIRPRMNPSDPLRGARHSFRQPASGVIRDARLS